MQGERTDLRQLFYDEPRPASTLLQICKIFDGFFLANQHAARDQEFLHNNKIALLINCAPQDLQLPPARSHTALAFDFHRLPRDKLNMTALLEVIASMQHCLHRRCEGVAVVGRTIDSRCLAMATLYLMLKYGWTLDRSLQFLHPKRPGLALTGQLMGMLGELDARGDRGKLTAAFETETTREEEILLTNTHINSRANTLPNFHGLTLDKPAHIPQDTKDGRKKVRFRLQSQPIGAIQTRLKQFIRQRCSGDDQKPLKDQKEVILIRNKDIIRRLPRRRAQSKTEQSHTEESSALSHIQTNNYISLDKDLQDSYRISKEKDTHHHQQQQHNKKYKLGKRCHTQDPNSDLLDDSFKEDDQRTNLFKITKSNKTSTKKMRPTDSPLHPPTKFSQKCIGWEKIEDSYEEKSLYEATRQPVMKPKNNTSVHTVQNDGRTESRRTLKRTLQNKKFSKKYDLEIKPDQ